MVNTKGASPPPVFVRVELNPYPTVSLPEVIAFTVTTPLQISRRDQPGD